MINHHNSIKKQRGKVVYYESVVGEIISKVCTVCGELLPLRKFSKRTNYLGDKDSKCKICDYEQRLKRSLSAISKKKKSNKKVQRPGTMKMKDYLKKLERGKKKS